MISQVSLELRESRGCLGVVAASAQGGGAEFEPKRGLFSVMVITLVPESRRFIRPGPFASGVASSRGGSTEEIQRSPTTPHCSFMVGRGVYQVLVSLISWYTA